MAGGWMHSIPVPFIRPPTGSAPGHKLRKPSKESGMFESLGTISFVLFYQKAETKGGPWHNAPRKYAPAYRSHRLGACEPTISSFKRG